MQTESRSVTYREFKNEMFIAGWRDKDGRVPHILTEKDTEFISTYPIAAGGYGKFIELKCPIKPLTIIAISGAIQEPDVKHQISLRCRDDTGFEMPSGTQLSLMRLNSTGKGIPFTDLYFTYNQISAARGSRFKQEAERFYLREKGQILYGGEKLVFNVYDSDIDIVKTEVRLMCDIFVKEDKEK